MRDQLDTPRTDAIYNKRPSDMSFCDWISSLAEIARQLERELNEARRKLILMEAQVQALIGTHNQMGQDRDALAVKVKRLTQDLMDPPADVQEAVIQKLNLVSGEVLVEGNALAAKLEKAMGVLEEFLEREAHDTKVCDCRGCTTLRELEETKP